jgi:hypothetical protein
MVAHDAEASMGTVGLAATALVLEIRADELTAWSDAPRPNPAGAARRVRPWSSLLPRLVERYEL